MENVNDVLELLDILYAMVNEAWGVPLGNDKCIIEREKAIDIINEIKANLPTSIAESKRLVQARDEFIGNAKREAESLRKNAEEQAAALIDQQQITKAARQKSIDMLKAAEAKSNELRRLASEYVDDMMRKTEESLNDALTTVRNTQANFRSAGITKTPVENVEVHQASVADEEDEENPEKPAAREKQSPRKISGDIPLDFGESDWRNE